MGLSQKVSSTSILPEFANVCGMNISFHHHIADLKKPSRNRGTADLATIYSGCKILFIPFMANLKVCATFGTLSEGLHYLLGQPLSKYQKFIEFS